MGLGLDLMDPTLLQVLMFFFFSIESFFIFNVCIGEQTQVLTSKFNLHHPQKLSIATFAVESLAMAISSPFV